MAHTILSLDGVWSLTGTDPDSGRTLTLPGNVPGHVHPDLVAAGHLPDPFWRDNADACQWVERWDWRYEREFNVPDDMPLDWVEVDFGGIDTYATILLNGTVLGTTANMLVPHRFVPGEALRRGINHLSVQVDTIWKHLEGKRLDYPAAFTSERVHVRRMQCTFHWDWVNRFVSAGIWRPVALVAHAGARATDLCVLTRGISADGADIEVRFTAEVRGGDGVQARLAIQGPDGTEVHAWGGPARTGEVRLWVGIDEPRLWWPVGHGDQPLYVATLTLTDASGKVLDRRQSRFGIRTIEVIQPVDVAGSAEEARTRQLRRELPDLDRSGDLPGSGFTCLVNGRPVFCRGGNWVPADPWPSRITPEHYAHLVGLAREAGVNCLRNWGGGIYEPDAFWDACDQQGVLVCQDFIMACAQYPEDEPGFMDALRAEIPVAIRMLRGHASLAWWNGDNENSMNSDWDDPAGWGRKVADQVTGPACAELDPSRAFFATSPIGGRPNNCPTIGDSHFSGFPMSKDALADLGDYRARIARNVGRFQSECTSAGVPALRSLRKFLSQEDLADPTAANWYFHTKDNPYLDVRLFDTQRLLAQALYGEADTVEDRIARQEYAQAEWVRLTLEATRRSAWYCSGLLFWMFNDCWPATGWSLVDYYGLPKAGWYGLKRGCRPIIGSIEETDAGYRFWTTSDLPHEVDATLTISVQAWGGAIGEPRCFTTLVPAGKATAPIEVAREDLAGLDAGSLLVLDLDWREGKDRAWFYPGMPWFMAPPPVTLKVKPVDGGVLVKAAGYARVVTLDGDAVFSDNYFDLLAGEERLISYRPLPGAAADQQISVRCWNAHE